MRGTVSLNGAQLDGLKFHQRVRRGLGRTWQHVRLFPSLPVIDNLLIGTPTIREKASSTFSSEPLD